MGSGKTTVGRVLAKRLNKRFIDSDHEIEARTGASIPVIFEVEGEASFRRREADIIRELTALDNIVLATGGGAILNGDSRMLLKQRGTVLYLRASVANLLQRTSHDKNRPLLRVSNQRQRIEELDVERDPLYREVAHLVIDTGRPNVQSLVQTILARLGTASGTASSSSSSSSQSGFSRTTSETAASKARGAASSSFFSDFMSLPITLEVPLDDRSYPILIGKSLLEDAEQLRRLIPGKRVAVVTNTIVAPLYLDAFSRALNVAGKQVLPIVLPDGEEEKNWHNVMRIFDALLEHKCDRKTTLVALGGGVIGDMTGFAAATYMRGVPFVQVPTTLLAQVDSSVGGKTGINHPHGKNMIGAFYQPQAVLADISTLDTLPLRELAAGLAEVIKHGAIIDSLFFNWLEANMAKLLARDPAALAYVIQRSCEIKSDVVRQDEREGGLRAILNFGHTFGHAIEAGMGYGKWLHGEAVGCGMVMAADLSCRMGYLSQTESQRIRALVAAAGLPVVAPYMNTQRWLELMEVDKKNEGGQVRFVLLKPLGTALITPAPQELLLQTLSACSQPT